MPCARIYLNSNDETKKKVLRHLPGSGCIELLIQSHDTTESHGERAYGGT